MPLERRQGLRVSACLIEDVSTSIKKLNIQKCEIPLEPAWEQQPHGQDSWPGAWHHRQTKVGFSQPGSLTFTGTYICLPRFSQKEKKKNVLLHPAQKKKAPFICRSLAGHGRLPRSWKTQGSPLTSGTIKRSYLFWHACIFFPLWSFHFCAFPSCHLMFPFCCKKKSCQLPGQAGLQPIQGERGEQAPPSRLVYHQPPLPQLSPSTRHNTWAQPHAPCVNYSLWPLFMIFSLSPIIAVVCHTGERDLKGFQK